MYKVQVGVCGLVLFGLLGLVFVYGGLFAFLIAFIATLASHRMAVVTAHEELAELTKTLISLSAENSRYYQKFGELEESSAT